MKKFWQWFTGYNELEIKFDDEEDGDGITIGFIPWLLLVQVIVIIVIPIMIVETFF